VLVEVLLLDELLLEEEPAPEDELFVLPAAEPAASLL
jgi:hypothetical protein